MGTPVALRPPTVETSVTPVAPAVGTFLVPTLPASMITSSLKRRIIRGVFRLIEAGMLLRFLRHPTKIRQAAEQLKLRRQQYFGEFTEKKIAGVDGRYYQGYYTPGWPSPAYTAYVVNTLNRIAPFREEKPALNQVFLAITKKCPLACQHCFEWDALNKKEKLSLADLKAMVEKFQAKHVTQLFFSGGEPMLRVHDILEVLQTARPGTDFWVITSGFHFTLENATRLKQAGLTGVCISLDHYQPDWHNAFRGSDTAYENALLAAIHARQVGLVVNLTVCATREFTTEANLMRYARLAKKLGVAFIQLLEPRAVGHYAAKNVALNEEQLSVLDAFYEKLNFNPTYLDWPIVTYYGYHQRRLGCSGASDRFLYVDTDGDIHACPFCQKKSGSALDCSLEQSLENVRTQGCHQFPASSV